MDRQHAIYTTETTCQDCYRCIRACPVKAIRVIDGHAAIDPDLCVACGACVDVCPSGAKTVRDDLGRAMALLERKQAVYVSLAPSFAGEFPEFRPAQLVAALQALGCAGVSETALGADLVSHAVATTLAKGEHKLLLSSACPAAVDFIRMYIPDQAQHLTELYSPMLAHARLLKETYGDTCGIIFVGPCIAKKRESDRHPELVDVALTFQELRVWLEAQALDKPCDCEAAFVPKAAINGARYPVVGGMIDTLRPYGLSASCFMTVAGLQNVETYLDNLDPAALRSRVFVELLACEGGCVAGPCTRTDRPRLLNEAAVRGYAGDIRTPGAAQHFLLRETYPGQPLPDGVPAAVDLSAALARVGKHSPDDELNCGGCGYDSCRAFARAMLAGRAEPDMCVSYLRQRAQRKANALLRCMPSGVVIVDKSLKVLECNHKFALLAGRGADYAYAARPGLGGADLKRLLPFHARFRAVLDTGQQYSCDMLRYEERLLSVTIFPIEPGETVGGILLDVTDSKLRREDIVKRARRVIDRNASTVQDIACKLGEHMAETEILLRTIAEGFSEYTEYDG